MVKVLRVCHITENYIELTNNGTPHLKVFKYEEVSAAKPATLKNVYNDSMQPIFARVLESICVGSQQRVCFEQLLSITKTCVQQRELLNYIYLYSMFQYYNATFFLYGSYHRNAGKVTWLWWFINTPRD